MRLKNIRLRASLGRSNGIYAFKTKPSDLHEFAPVYRMMSERNRYDAIANSIHTFDTMYACGDNGYKESAKFWKDVPLIMSNAWDEDAFLYEEIEYWGYVSIKKARRSYNALIHGLGVERFRKEYIPIRWETVGMTLSNMFSSAQDLMFKSAGIRAMPLKNYALGEINGRDVLFASKRWLSTFSVGIQLINYYRMAKERKFDEVYKF